MKPHPIYEKAKRGEWINHADRAKLIRSALATNFPGVKFSVTTSTYSGGGSVRVSWMDGPSSKQVERVAGQFETQGFDGSIDMAHSRDLWLAPDGTASVAHDCGTQGSMGYAPEIIGSAHHPDAVLVSNICSGFVSCSQRISPERLRKAVEAIRAENWADLASFNWEAVTIEQSDYDGSGHLKGPAADTPTSWAGRWLDAVIYRRAHEFSELEAAR